MAEHVFDGWRSSFIATSSFSGGFESGAPIEFDRGGTIYGLRYYHRQSADTYPDTLALWTWSPGVSNPALVERRSVPSPVGATGWQDIALVTPLDVAAGDVVVVSQKAASSWNYAHPGFSGIAWRPRTLTAGLTTYGNFCNVAWNSAGTFLGGSSDVVNVDISWEPVPFGDFTLSELTDEFERWLTAGGDKYAESDLPAIKGQAEGANTNAQSAWETAQEVQTDLGAFRDEWPGTLATALQGGLNTIGDWLSTESDWYQTLVNQTAPQVANLVDGLGDFTGITVFNYLSDLIRWANGVNQPPALAEGDDWELVDETDFVNNLEWPVEADLYRVHLTSFDPAGTSEPIGTLTRHAYLGKWSPLNGTFSRQWQYFNTEDADLTIYRRLPGLGLGLYRPGAGHVQAWRRVEAP